MDIETKISSKPIRQYSSITRFLALVFSVVFHPLLVTSYIVAFFVFFHASVFTGFDHQTMIFRFFTVLLFTSAFPFFAVFLCWRLKLVKSIYLSTTRDRIIPYIIVMFFYWWTFYVFNNLPDSPSVIKHLLLGSFLAVCGGWICNIYFKISMHAIAMGGLLMFFLLFVFNDSYASGLYLSIAVLIAGAVCTSRFIVSDHSSKEIYAGLIIGLIAQVIGWIFPL
jgi:hypothetical protein